MIKKTFENPSPKPIPRRGIMLVLSSPSGAGKTSLARALLKDDENISMSISTTTRPPRPSEKEGVDYNFKTDEQFKKEIDKEAFLEWALVFGHHYGTPKKPVLTKLDKGFDVLFDIDWQGTQQIYEKCSKDVVRVFILPPSARELEGRLVKRAEDKPEIVKKRMMEASAQMSHWPEYDYIIINEDFDKALGELKAILQAERLKRERQTGLSHFVRAMQDQL